MIADVTAPRPARAVRGNAWLQALVLLAAVLVVILAFALVSAPRPSSEPERFAVATAAIGTDVRLWYPRAPEGVGLRPLVLIDEVDGHAGLDVDRLASSLAAAGTVVLAPAAARRTLVDHPRFGALVDPARTIALGGAAALMLAGAAPDVRAAIVVEPTPVAAFDPHFLATLESPTLVVGFARSDARHPGRTEARMLSVALPQRRTRYAELDPRGLTDAALHDGLARVIVAFLERPPGAASLLTTEPTEQP